MAGNPNLEGRAATTAMYLDIQRAYFDTLRGIGFKAGLIFVK